MYVIETTGLFRTKRRLVASAKLAASDFDAIAAELGAVPVRARKISYVAAFRSQERRTVETRWKGELTRSTAEPGDWIVTNMTADRKILRDSFGNVNRYVITGPNFERLYTRAVGETEFGQIFQGKGVVDALFLSGGLDIVAPWGERQSMGAGYLLRNGAEVYGNERATFHQTYELL